MKQENLKQQYRDLIQQLKEKAKQKGVTITNKFIAESLGYRSRTHLSSLLGKRANVTPNHIKDLILHFPKELGGKIQHEAQPPAVEETAPQHDIESQRYLERTLDRLSEDKLRSTAIIERLVTLLEHSFSSSLLSKAPAKPSAKDSLKEGPLAEGDLGLGKKYVNKGSTKGK